MVELISVSLSIAALARADGKTSRITAENTKPGSRDWMLTKTHIGPATKYRCPWIEGYASAMSVRAGESIRFHVSTRPVSRWSLLIYRMGFYGGDGGRLVADLGAFEGVEQPEPPVGDTRLRECAWAVGAEWRVPADAVSGVYLGKLTAEVDGTQSYVIFIMRDDRKADFIFQCSDPPGRLTTAGHRSSRSMTIGRMSGIGAAVCSGL